MKKELKEKIENVICKFLFKSNDNIIRGKIINKLNKLSHIQFIDETAEKMVNNNCAFFVGADPIDNKLIYLTIEPTQI